MKKISIAMLLGFTLVLSGCATSGNQSLKDENETSVQAKITKGKTTKEELKTTFGSPMSVTFNSDGNEMWVYSFASVSADAVNFIPFVGLFGSSYSGENKMLTIVFEENIVKNYSMTSSNMDTKTGLLR